MDIETLTEALGRAEAARRPLAEHLRARQEESAGTAKRQEELEKAPRSSDRTEYLRNAEYLHTALTAVALLKPRVQAAQDLEHALKYLPYDWHAAMPGRGLFVVRFFVRSFRIDDGKPAAFDPFWIETCVKRDGAGDGDLLALHAAWASGGALRPGGKGPSDPLLPVRKPFGAESEAAREPCDCGASGYVIGFKEMTHWTEDDDWPYLQSLSVLCLACPRLTTFAERRDLPPPKLYP